MDTQPLSTDRLSPQFLFPTSTNVRVVRHLPSEHTPSIATNDCTGRSNHQRSQPESLPSLMTTTTTPIAPVASFRLSVSDKSNPKESPLTMSFRSLYQQQRQLLRSQQHVYSPEKSLSTSTVATTSERTVIATSNKENQMSSGRITKNNGRTRRGGSTGSGGGFLRRRKVDSSDRDDESISVYSNATTVKAGTVPFRPSKPSTRPLAVLSEPTTSTGQQKPRRFWRRSKKNTSGVMKHNRGDKQKNVNDNESRRKNSRGRNSNNTSRPIATPTAHHIAPIRRRHNHGQKKEMPLTMRRFIRQQLLQQHLQQQRQQQQQRVRTASESTEATMATMYRCEV